MTLKYTVVAKNPHAHIFAVALRIEKPNPLGQVFMLPNWTPGSYRIRDFAKHIIKIAAADENGKILNLKKLDKNHWFCEPAKTIILSAEIYAFDTSPRGAFLSIERGFWGGACLFFLPLGSENENCELEVFAPENPETQNWQIKSAMPLLKKTKKSVLFSAENYLDLIDYPLGMADFQNFEWTQNGKHRLAIAGAKNINAPNLEKDLKKICAHHQNFFQATPFSEYLFLVDATADGYGGIEHKNSTRLVCARDDLDAEKSTDGYTRFLTLCAHEYFHAWWVKIVRPADFHNLDLNRENPTTQLWIFEGFTAYYDELSLLRQKIITPETYLALLEKTIERFIEAPGRFCQTLTEASFDAWIKFYQPGENSANATVNYYVKGALLAFVLDIEIRKKTDDKKCLDDILRHIWKKYQKNGLADGEMEAEITKFCGADFDDFFAKYLYGTEDLPLAKMFEDVGIDYRLVRKNDGAALGIRTRAAGDFLKITEVRSGSCAQKYGLYVGDFIIAVDFVRADKDTFAERMKRQKPGETVIISIFRDQILTDIKMKLDEPPKTKVSLKIKKNLAPKTKARQQRWFYQNR